MNKKRRNFERELPDGYTEIKHLNAKDMKLGIILNLIAMLVLVLVMAGAFMLLGLRDGPVIDLELSISGLSELSAAMIVFLASMFLYIILHELVHGVAYKALTGEKLTFGMSWSCAFCGVPDIYVYRRCALIAVVAPFLLFTVLFIPALAILYFLSPLYFLIFAFIFGLHLGGCSGDLLVLYLLTVKFKDKDALMRDTGPEQFFYIKNKD